MMIPPLFLYTELNCFAIAILFVIVLNMRRSDGQYTLDQKLFFALLAINILLLSLDTTLRMLDGRPGGFVRGVCISAIVLYNILNPIICLVWYYYVDYYVYGSKERIGRMLLPMLLPVLINLVLSVASIFADIYFVFDGNNVYHRGRIFMILLGICLYMVVYTAVFLIRNREKIGPKEYAYLLFFAVPPMVGGIIQAMVPGVVVIWITATLSIFIIFINIQKDQLYTDYLTGVNNRRHLDNYLQTLLKNQRNGLIAGIMIDMNSFKRINDLYGHDKGDQALKDTAQLLRSTFRKTDFIARYGGDEFVVLMEIGEQPELAAMVRRLKENVSRFNAHKAAPYEIDLSIGYDCYRKESGISASEFIKRIDHLMYLDKEKNACE